MRADAEGYVARIDAALNLVKMSLDWDRALRRLDELNAKVEDPTLWDNPKAAEEVMRERRRLDAAISTVREIDADKSGTVELIELAEMEGDAELGDEGAASLKALADRADKDKVMALLSGEADGNDTFIEIHAGAGGTESQDWAEMLQRMYYRWAEQRGYKVEMVDYQAGDQAESSRRRSWSKAKMLMAMPRPKAASIASSAFRLMTAQPSATQASPASGSILSLMTISILKSTKAI
jgi:peptide chain release factor 2